MVAQNDRVNHQQWQRYTGTAKQVIKTGIARTGEMVLHVMVLKTKRPRTLELTLQEKRVTAHNGNTHFNTHTCAHTHTYECKAI